MGVAFASLIAVGCGGADVASDEQDEVERRAWTPPPPREGNLRVATFNIRNFPTVPIDPTAEPQPPPTTYLAETDREALLSVLAKLSFDVMAVQEIRDREALDELLAEHGEQLGRRFEAVYSENLSGNDQHVGVVYDADKLRLAWSREHAEVDVKGTLRPGLSARLESTREGGVDLTLMVLHLASGDSVKRATLRAQQASAAAAVAAAQIAELEDDDYLILGDLNTARGEAELGALDAAFAVDTALDRLDNAASCTSYWLKSSSKPLVRPSLLDQVYAASLAERDLDVPLESGAHCYEVSCRQFESRDAKSGSTFYSVSDHCPVYFEVADNDDD
jgi:predicted extracellular nuclease